MTEITIESRKLAPAVERFILHWGDMGNQWGVNRSVAQIHALLYLSERPLTAEDIADTLGLARSNVSNSLKELIGWKLIRRVPVLGDRRDHYEAETDLFEMVTRIAQGRKEREIDPAAAALRACMAEAEGRSEGEPGRPRAARRDAGVRGDAEPLVRSDAWRAAGEDHVADQHGRQGREFPQLREGQGDAGRASFLFDVFLSFQK